MSRRCFIPFRNSTPKVDVNERYEDKQQYNPQPKVGSGLADKVESKLSKLNISKPKVEREKNRKNVTMNF